MQGKQIIIQFYHFTNYLEFNSKLIQEKALNFPNIWRKYAKIYPNSSMKICLNSVSGGRPWSRAQWAGRLRLDPSLDAVIVEWMIAFSPNDLTISLSLWITHANRTRLGKELLANCAIFDLSIPVPNGYGVPLLQFEHLFAACRGFYFHFSVFLLCFYKILSRSIKHFKCLIVGQLIVLEEKNKFYAIFWHLSIKFAKLRKVIGIEILLK